MRKGWIKTAASFLAVLMLITSLPMESFAQEEINTAAEEGEEEADSAAETDSLTDAEEEEHYRQMMEEHEAEKKAELKEREEKWQKELDEIRKREGRSDIASEGKTALRTSETYNGSYKGLQWNVTKEGTLTISGTATEEFGAFSDGLIIFRTIMMLQSKKLL